MSPTQVRVVYQPPPFKHPENLRFFQESTFPPFKGERPVLEGALLLQPSLIKNVGFNRDFASFRLLSALGLGQGDNFLGIIPRFNPITIRGIIHSISRYNKR